MVLSSRFLFKVDYSFPIMFCRGRMVVGFITTCAICTYPGADPGFQVRGVYLKKIAPSGGRGENIWGISCEKSRFYAKKIIFFPILGGGGGGGARRVRLPPKSALAITTNIVSPNPVHGEVYSIQYHVIKFVSDLRQLGGFLRVLRFPPQIKLTATI